MSRAVLCRKSGDSRGGNDTSSSTTAISLGTIKESLWWARFVYEDYESQSPNIIKTNISLKDVLHILGAGSPDNDTTTTLRSASGLRYHARFDRAVFDSDACPSPWPADYKSALLQLSPARSLRSALHTKLVAALGYSPSHPALESFGRIQGAQAPLRPRLHRSLVGHSDSICIVAVSPDGERVISCSKDGTAKVWNADTGLPLCTFRGHTGELCCAALSPDGQRMVSAGRDCVLRVWGTATGQQHRFFTERNEAVIALAVSPDGATVAASSTDCLIRLWSMDSGRLLTKLEGHTDAVNSVAFSPDGQMLASGSDDDTIKLWDTQVMAIKHSIPTENYGQLPWSPIVDAMGPMGIRVAFTPDSNRLVSVVIGKAIKVWSWDGGRIALDLMIPVTFVLNFAVFPDGDRTAVSSADGTIRIWNLHSGELEHSLPGSASVFSVFVSRNGQTMASGGFDEKVAVWKLR